MNKQFIAFAFILLCGVQCAPLEDKVNQLPDLPNLTYDVYSGYLDLPNTSKSVHYMFEASQRNPTNDPVVLWLQGGPGCSSLTGWATEMGSFTNTKVNEFTKNQYSWNLISNMIYFEAPVGVGFSYATEDSDKQTGDDQTAKDNLQSLLEFFKKYPELKNNEFYITGESYGGIYVPTLALKIVEHNAKASEIDQINLKGFAVGNGVTNWKYDTANATMEMLTTHAFVSKKDQEIWKENDCQQKVPHQSKVVRTVQKILSNNSICTNLIAKFNNLFQGYNPYNLYYECNAAAAPITESQNNKLQSYKKMNSFINGVPCNQDDFAVHYFNREDVKAALHIRPQSAATWGECATIPFEIDYKGSIWTYPELIKAGLRIWIYSGDVDGIVPYPGTRNWIYHDLNPKVTKEWAQWQYWGRPAGFVEEYEGLTFVTVNGAGHEVPMYKPAQAFKMFSYFLEGKSLD